MTDMSPAYDPLPTDAMREQAQRWLLRLQSGQATVDDAEAFRRWRAADPRHAVAVA
ncbi:TPA: DUF4880 domain-containing protein, partial [Stenotrophomonas maltophilia]|nr:DUF4880 domain-containing protein [Stenotrophomonas maltophilia]